jgi:V/A-type H+/Na+-transporting ATPase subunit D
MIGSATRSRLFELRRDRVAARRSAELLDHKREVLLREISRRQRLLQEIRNVANARYAEAHRLLRMARVELGMRGVEAAALAQPPRCTLAQRERSVMGVRIPELDATVQPYRAFYGAAATAESLDEAGAAFTDLLPSVVALAQEEIAVARLTTAMRKTTKLFNALQKVVLPRIEQEIRAIVDGIEEDERDDAVRRRVTVAHETAKAYPQMTQMDADGRRLKTV